MSKTVASSWNDFDPLEHTIVGRADFTCIPPSEPATEAKSPEDSDMRGMWGPRPLEAVEKANAELDHLVSVVVEASEVYQQEPLDGFGFEVIPVPFRGACPFGGGLHCATGDVFRRGDCEDYFPKQIPGTRIRPI